ncbi:MAG TPA: hypothetical protein VNF47_02925 [Streptosporangiaceae bacterium]|nr:hypothetical protein [Streptosporangiaceae bacterium]
MALDLADLQGRPEALGMYGAGQHHAVQPFSEELGAWFVHRDEEIKVHIQSHPQFRFGRCKRIPKKGQTCPFPQ